MYHPVPHGGTEPHDAGVSCDRCGRVFSSRRGLTLHRRVCLASSGSREGSLPVFALASGGNTGGGDCRQADTRTNHDDGSRGSNSGSREGTLPVFALAAGGNTGGGDCRQEDTRTHHNDRSVCLTSGSSREGSSSARTPAAGGVSRDGSGKSDGSSSVRHGQPAARTPVTRGTSDGQRAGCCLLLHWSPVAVAVGRRTPDLLLPMPIG